MNTFCLECTAQDRGVVRECGDKNCPFWQHRSADLPYQVENRRRTERRKKWKQVLEVVR